MILLLFPYPAIRTGGHKRYLELVRGIVAVGRNALLLKHADFDPALPGLASLDICRGKKPPYLSRSAFFRLSVRSALTHIAGQGSPEGVVVFGETLYPAAELLKRKFKIPLLFAFRSNMHQEFRLFGRPTPLNLLKRLVGRFREANILHRADAIVVQSSFDKEDFLRRFPAADIDKITIIPNNVNASWMNPAYRDSNRSDSLRRLLFIGAFNERKGLPLLMEAYGELRRAGFELYLDLIGFGELESRLANQIEENGWTERVRLLGRLDDPFENLAQADLLVVPSLYDSYPNVVLEALHTGTPVIGAASGGIPDILKFDELLFTPGSLEALTLKIRELMQPEAYRRARLLCRERRESFDFDWPGRFLDLLDSL